MPQKLLMFVSAAFFGFLAASASQADTFNAVTSSKTDQAYLINVHDPRDDDRDDYEDDYKSYKTEKHNPKIEDDFSEGITFKKKHKYKKHKYGYEDDYGHNPYYYSKSPKQVRHILQKKGFHRIYFTDRKLPLYKLNACRSGLRYQIYVKYNGAIKRSREVGYCSTGSRYKDYWRSPKYFR